MKKIIIGYGEIGKALSDVFHIKDIHDLDKGKICGGQFDLMLVAIPYSDNFIEIVNSYIEKFKIKETIIFSTVAIGTTRKIPNAVHSPVEGKHPELAYSIRKAKRWVGGYSKLVDEFFKEHDFNPVYVTPETTEFLKLRSTSLYGLNIEFARYSKEVCDKLEINYHHVKQFDLDYNILYKHLGMPQYQRYILYPPKGNEKGHCITPNAKILNEQFPSIFLEEIIRDKEAKEND